MSPAPHSCRPPFSQPHTCLISAFWSLSCHLALQPLSWAHARSGITFYLPVAMALTTMGLSPSFSTTFPIPFYFRAFGPGRRLQVAAGPATPHCLAVWTLLSFFLATDILRTSSLPRPRPSVFSGRALLSLTGHFLRAGLSEPPGPGRASQLYSPQPHLSANPHIVLSP